MRQEIIKAIQEELRKKYGSLNDCCTNSNYLFVWAWKRTGHTVCDCVRMRGDVIITSDDETYTVDHEWLEIEGELLDITAEQFEAIS